MGKYNLFYTPYSKGGLKSQNITWHYWAVKLRTIKFYFAKSDIPQWKEMESESLSLPLPQYLYSDTLLKFLFISSTQKFHKNEPK